MNSAILILNVLIFIVTTFTLIYMIRRDKVILIFKKIKLGKTETGLLAIGCRLWNRSDFNVTFDKYYLILNDGSTIKPYYSCQTYIIRPKSDISFAPQFEMPNTPKVKLVIELTTGQQISKKLNLKKLLRE